MQAWSPCCVVVLCTVQGMVRLEILQLFLDDDVDVREIRHYDCERDGSNGESNNRSMK